MQNYVDNKWQYGEWHFLLTLSGKINKEIVW